jgi:hypothetical protein
VPEYQVVPSASPPTRWTTPTFQGFKLGNPSGFKPFVWKSSLGMTAFMTPVNGAFNPLPTEVLYEWKPDSEYSVATDRAQRTMMGYQYNPGNMATQEALLFGPAPRGTTPPPGSDTSYLISFYSNGNPSCVGPPNFDFPQEPPNWVSIPAVQGTLQCTITNNPVVCPVPVVTVYSVLFPPAPPNYPDSTYLWTWYAPFQGSDGTHSRPITFMQSQSGVGVGTSLALADYFAYVEPSNPINPSYFAVPSACATVTAEKETKG